MKTETKTIGRFTYRMRQIGTESGEQIVLRLSRPAAALFAKAASKGDKGTLGDIVEGLPQALGALTGKDLRYVRKKLAEATEFAIPDSKGQAWLKLADHYDLHFAGRYDDVLTWMKWGITMNRFFGDALQRWAALAAQAAQKAAESPSSSPQESPGGPGGSSSPSTDARA